jgi:phage anti-repressor protein
MNRNIVPKAINFNELVKNSNNTLSLNLQSKMICLLNDEFTEKEQQWYIANLYMYMNYHPTNDFPINLEHVFKMIGFANKGNAMKTIKSNFVEDEDYKIIIFRTEKNKSIQETRGRKEETVMLNIDMFKNLCMMVKTEKGKQIRKYYVKLENIYNEIIKEEIDERQKQLEHQKLLLKHKIEETEQEKYKIQAQNSILKIELGEREHTINVLTKKTNKFKPGQSVYIFRSTHDNKNIYKIGRTKNCNDREYTHKTATFDGEIIHQVMCSNSCVLERVCHFLLDKYKLAKTREWFNASFDIIRTAVDYAKLIVDCDIDFENKNLLTLTKTFIETIKEKVNVGNVVGNVNVGNADNVNEDVDNTNEDVCFTELNMNEYINDPNNFEKFIIDCCEFNENYSVSYIELKNQYKIWSKTANHTQLKTMIEYVKTNFKSSMKRANPLVSTSKLTGFFNGIKIKDIFYNFDKVDNNKLIIENYLYNNCQKAPGYRLTINELFQDFEQYCKNTLNFDISYYHKEKIKDLFDIMFVRLRKGISNSQVDCRLGGWLGVALKNVKDPEPLRNYNPKNRKKICAMDILTKKIIKEWQSVTDASEELKRSRTVVSSIIKRHQVININNCECILRYINDG